MTFEIPEDISALDAAAIQAAIDAAMQEASAIDGEADELSTEQVDRLTALATFVRDARNRAGELAAEAESRRTAAADARALLAPVAEETEETTAEDNEEAAAETESEVEGPQETKVTASAKRQVVAAAAKKAPKVETKTVSLVASADVPGHATGAAFSDMAQVGTAMLRKLESLPKNRLGGKDGMRQRYSVASIERESVQTDGLSQTAFGRDDMALLQAASKESRLPGGSLVAAGGWCAPSETIYDICTTATTDGLINLPETTINRGGIRYTSGPDFSAIYDEISDFCMTEQDVIDGQTKDCITVDCPDFVEVRLEACWLCIRVPLLTQAGYPEYVQAFIDQAVIANAHKMSARDVTKILAGSDPMDATGDYGNAIDPLAELELVAAYQRQAFAMSDSATLEILLPSWYKTVIRADLARRNGVDLTNVTDAQIQSYFGTRQLSVQWLKYMYPIQNDAGSLSLPATIEVPMYPAGTWVRGTKPVISLDAVYDSQSLSQNEYTAMFVEDGSLLAQMCYDSVKVTIPTCATGRTGAADLVDCVLGSASS